MIAGIVGIIAMAIILLFIWCCLKVGDKDER